MEGSCPSDCCCIEPVYLTRRSNTELRLEGNLVGSGCGQDEGDSEIFMLDDVTSRDKHELRALGQDFTFWRTTTGLDSENAQYPQCGVTYNNGIAAVVPQLFIGAMLVLSVVTMLF